MFRRFYDEGLAQASFLLGCDRTGQAVVIDPRRDASIYVEAARQAGATIVAAIETHVHADFVSGARELASAGARVFTGVVIGNVVVAGPGDR
jgi:hydroxyacylglutathione hydrolase